jgi:hypothetical protein
VSVREVYAPCDQDNVKKGDVIGLIYSCYVCRRATPAGPGLLPEGWTKTKIEVPESFRGIDEKVQDKDVYREVEGFDEILNDEVFRYDCSRCVRPAKKHE